MKTAVILYEISQLVLLDGLMAKRGEGGAAPLIVSLDAEIDFALEKRGIPFISGKTLQNRTAPATYVRAEEIIRGICTNPALSFFQYRGVSLLESLRFSIHVYLLRLFYFIDVIGRFLERGYGITHLVVPVSVVFASKTSDPLAGEESLAAYEAARLVAESRGIQCERYDIVSASLQLSGRVREWVFALKRASFGLALSFLNVLMNLRPHRPIRMLGSDYWRSFGPILQKLPEAELVLLDRSEALRAGLRNIWRHKIQFVHISQFLTRKGKRHALAHAKKCKEEWATVKKGVLQSVDLSFCGVHLFDALDRIMTHAIEVAIPDIVCDTEGTYSMYGRLSPDAVLLRASASRQRHFSILPLVAQQVGIPALEVQHGGEYLGTGSGTREHAAYFLATYGPLVCDEFRALGYEKERLLPIGSPRFDAYMRAVPKSVSREKGGDFIVLSNTPTMDVNERYGTYSVEEYFNTLGKAFRAIPDAKLKITSRSATVRAAFLEEARARGLVGVNYESVGITPLPELFRQADIFVCSYSTVVYEALLYRLPVILAAFAPVEKMMADFHFSHFEKAGALLIAHSPEELSAMLHKLSSDADARARMSALAWEFMQKNFSFDGRASERIATLVRKWSKRVSV